MTPETCGKAKELRRIAALATEADAGSVCVNDQRKDERAGVCTAAFAHALQREIGFKAELTPCVVTRAGRLPRG